jgi:hypothetical protein
MKDLMGWVGSLTSFRVGHQIVESLTGFKCSLMSIWRSVQSYSKKISLAPSSDGTNEFEADRTGIPTKGSGKRGSEMKKVFQRKKDGSLQLVGITIGKHKDKTGWKSILSTPIKEVLKRFDKIGLSSDRDTSITDTATEIDAKVKIQKDIWHVFHQMKYYLWKDKVAKEKRGNVIKLVYKITMILTQFSSDKRLEISNSVIQTLKVNGCNHTVTYLKSAMSGFYTYEKEGNTNVFTTKTERSMRINIGIWSDQGALNVTKIRLANYYNGISPSNWKNNE